MTRLGINNIPSLSDKFHKVEKNTTEKIKLRLPNPIGYGFTIKILAIAWRKVTHKTLKIQANREKCSKPKQPARFYFVFSKVDRKFFVPLSEIILLQYA
jgi:hypothetical protein